MKGGRTLESVGLDDLMRHARDDGAGCLVWQGHAHQGKFPQWRVGGGAAPVRRGLYQLVHGPVPRNMHVGVLCGCELCVHPDHLVARSRKRAAHRGPMRATHKLALTKSLRRKSTCMTMEIARAIRASDEPGVVLEARYGLRQGYASRIRLGLVWVDTASPFAGLGAR